MAHPKSGQIGWLDLTVADAAGVRDFYQHVIGWNSQAVSMDGYDDWCMLPSTSEHPVAGICHARGSNADLPPIWMVYFHVDDLEQSSAAVIEHGGKVLREPQSAGGGRFCVIEDPAGAVCALYAG